MADTTSVPDETVLGQVLRDRRRHLNLTQTDVAIEVGIRTNTVSDIENGKSTARIGIVFRIAAILGVDIIASVRS